MAQALSVQYLNERKRFEVAFLETLSRSRILTAILWGAHDMVAPVRVADYVFETALKSRGVTGAYWLMPCGNHYVQHDQSAAIAQFVRLSFTKGPANAPLNLATDACSPVLVARETH